MRKNVDLVLKTSLRSPRGVPTTTTGYVFHFFRSTPLQLFPPAEVEMRCPFPPRAMGTSPRCPCSLRWRRSTPPLPYRSAPSQPPAAASVRVAPIPGSAGPRCPRAPWLPAGPRCTAAGGRATPRGRRAVPQLLAGHEDADVVGRSQGARAAGCYELPARMSGCDVGASRARGR